MSGCECAECLEHFVSVESFDAHRRDATADELATDNWMRRRCKTADDMAAAGWEQTPWGWRSPKSVRAVRRIAQKAASGGQEAA
jgi:hypothetical protein